MTNCCFDIRDSKVSNVPKDPNDLRDFNVQDHKLFVDDFIGSDENDKSGQNTHFYVLF